MEYLRLVVQLLLTNFNYSFYFLFCYSLYVQIINLCNVHWVCISNLLCKRGTVAVYDSQLPATLDDNFFLSAIAEDLHRQIAVIHGKEERQNVNGILQRCTKDQWQ